MEILKTLLGIVVAVMALGFTAISLLGAIQLLVLAFRKNLVWGFGSLFVWPVIVIFAIANWNEAKPPFIKWVGGGTALLLLVGTCVTLTIASTPAKQRQTSIPAGISTSNVKLRDI